MPLTNRGCLPNQQQNKSTDTFEVWSYSGIITRRPSHQFVQKVRRRHGHLPTPCSVFHFFTLNRAVRGDKTHSLHFIICDIFTTGCTIVLNMRYSSTQCKCWLIFLTRNSARGECRGIIYMSVFSVTFTLRISELSL